MKTVMQIENWRQRLSLSCLGCCLCVLFAGCPEKAHISVTIKPVAGAADASTGGDSAVETAAAGYGTLVGTVTYAGTPKDLPPLQPVGGDGTLKPEDKAICTAVAVPDESLVVNPTGGGLANAIIFLEKRPGNIKPELVKPSQEPLEFDQKGCRFFPHILIAEIGRPLLVYSDDPIPHNTHTRPKRNSEFNKLIPAHEAGTAREGVPCVYKKPESGPISVVCDLHNWMKAYHFPIDHPYAAVTDKDGHFKIEGLPAGKHFFNVWHERAAGSGQLLKRKLQITIEVDQETKADLSYGPAEFGNLGRSTRIRFDRGPVVPATGVPEISFDRLLEGGRIVVTQTQETP